MRKLNIHVGIVAYNLPQETAGLIESCISGNGHRVTMHLHLHSAFPEVVRVCELAATLPNLIYHPHKVNRGLAASWSDSVVDGFEMGADTVILVNDDVEFDCAPDLPEREGPETDLDLLAEFAINHPDKYLITLDGYHKYYADRPELPNSRPRLGFGFSCFALNRQAYDILGCFDRNFAPIYYEDCDFGRRGYLAGLQMDEVKNTRAVHYGSLSHRTDDVLANQHISTNARNLRYYIQKWGGGPGEETYPVPFNDPAFTLRINPMGRNAPYGLFYDRDDFAEVIKR